MIEVTPTFLGQRPVPMTRQRFRTLHELLEHGEPPESEKGRMVRLWSCGVQMTRKLLLTRTQKPCHEHKHRCESGWIVRIRRAFLKSDGGISPSASVSTSSGSAGAPGGGVE